jgi:hypothetical protein
VHDSRTTAVRRQSQGREVQRPTCAVLARRSTKRPSRDSCQGGERMGREGGGRVPIGERVVRGQHDKYLYLYMLAIPLHPPQGYGVPPSTSTDTSPAPRNRAC